jgi:hypothetical protein
MSPKNTQLTRASTQQAKRDPQSDTFAAARGGLGDRVPAGALQALHRKIGNQAVQHLLHPRIQTKLRVSAPEDAEEREAERVSDHVMRMPAPTLQRACSCGGACPACQSAPDERMQLSRAASGQSESTTPEVLPSVYEVLRSPGQPLDSSTRAFMEPRFGYDFSRVRVHTGVLAERSAHELNAQAYTVGHDIVFAAGRLSPDTEAGRRLIAHELTHVVQQGSGAPLVQRQPASSDPERDAAIAEAEAITSVTTEQLEEQADAEVRLHLNDRRKRDKRYGQLLALKDKARIERKRGISARHQQEIGVKLRFLKGEAKAAYLRTLRDVLSDYPEAAEEILSGPHAPPVTTRAVEERALQLGCDPDRHQYVLAYEGEPERARCMDILTDPEYRDNLFDRNIASAVGYAVNGTSWQNVQYDKFKVMLVTYKNGLSEYFMLDEIGNFQFGSNAKVIRDFVFMKRKTGYVYPVHDGQIYANEVLTPRLVAYKNGLKYQAKDLQALYALLVVAGTFAAITGAYGIVEGFRHSVNGFSRDKGGRRRWIRSTRRAVPTPEPENASAAPTQISEEASSEESAMINRIFEQVGGKDMGYNVKICNDSTVVEGPKTRWNVGLHAKSVGGATVDRQSKTVWVHESVIAQGASRVPGAAA